MCLPRSTRGIGLSSPTGVGADPEWEESTVNTNKIRRAAVAVAALVALGASVAACTPPTNGGGTGGTTTSTSPTQTSLPQD